MMMSALGLFTARC